MFLAGNLYASNVVLNDPYPANQNQKKIYYSSFTEQPKTLDPAKSYSLNEYLFVKQIYEPVLQYDYFVRPYKLIPLTAKSMPIVRYYDSNNNEVNAIRHEVARSVYTIHIKKGVLYQPHPGFVKTYYPLPIGYLKKNHIHTVSNFNQTATRELIADDYIYQIKRLADPRNTSPIHGLMKQYIVGFADFAKQLPRKVDDYGFIDLRDYPLTGLKKIDDYTFQISIIGHYPQFMFWLSMPFFAPIPWEVDRFYSQPEMRQKNLDFNWYPIGTGAFMMTENNPNRQMVLDKNPNYREEYFPSNGSNHDTQKGYLKHAGERIPMIDRAIYTLEKESIPRWSKFLQGYYDLSGITADSFDQAIQLDAKGNASLSARLQAKGMILEKTPELAIYYLGFNMLDPIVGGTSERARKLRQAISIAVNYDEYIAIFLNERGFAAQGPLPRGIFGHRIGRDGLNPAVYFWDGHAIKRRSIMDAKALMSEAGYPDGFEKNTGHRLILHYDVTATGGPEDKAELDWMRKQFAKIGIELDVRATQYNRFQEKMRSGNAQIYKWGWSADYPDPENFLFILYGPNGKVLHGGENASNYNNPHFNQLFDQMKNRPNDSTRQQMIDEMIAILRYDSPWIWGVHSELFALSQSWVSPLKPNSISTDTLKYTAIDVSLRNERRAQWNKPVIWPLGLFVLIIFLVLLPFVFAYRKQQKASATRANLSKQTRRRRH